MVLIPEEIKNDLKNPLGRIAQISEVIALSKKFKIITVGDISTLFCIEKGLIPFIAVFDFRYMRKPLDDARKAMLFRYFPDHLQVTNPPGTITKEFVAAASSLVKSNTGVGGAILVEGEEDLTALVLIALCDNKTIVVYGQPNEGLVLVEPNEVIKKKAKKILKKLNLLG